MDRIALLEQLVRKQQEQLRILGELVTEGLTDRARIAGRLEATELVLLEMIKLSPPAAQLRENVATAWLRLKQTQWPQHDIHQTLLGAAEAALAQLGVKLQRPETH